MPKSEQGVTADRYSIIPRTLIFLTRQAPGGLEVLLIKGAPTKRLWANRYNGVGGHIERGEDALSAARRELQEETGLESAHLRLVGTVLIDADVERGIGLFVFTGQYEGGRLIESSEGQLEWVPADRLAQYPLVEDLQVILPRILTLVPGSAPFSALYNYDSQDQLKVHLAD
jgi:8-oxo-dGTP diphosphatase